MKKRGQITIFIIIGLVILILVGVVVYFTYSFAERKETELIPTIEQLPNDLKPIQRFVMTCVEQTATEALIKLGEHGGYVELNNSEWLEEKKFKIDHIQPTDGDVVPLTTEHFVPYWWNLKPNNKCAADCVLTDEDIPSIFLMEDQISRYVEREISKCLANMSQFTEQGFTITPKKSPKAKTMIAREKIVVQLVYPMDIEKGESSSLAKEFYAEIPLNLRRMYELALLITFGEEANRYLELMSLNLISFYSGLDADKLPPIAEYTTDYKTVTWIKSLVKARYEQLLSSYVPIFQVENTMDAQQIAPGGSYADGFYNVFFLKNNETYPEIRVDFFYLDWPIYLHITPSNGELLKPSVFKNEFPMGIAPPIQTNNYEFFYDISYPVVVALRDPKAFNGQGYNFFFALESNIRDNIDMVSWHLGQGTIGEWSDDNINIKLSEDAPTEAIVDFDPITNQTINETFEAPKKRLFCREEARTSGDFTINVYDKNISQPLKDVLVSFVAPGYSICGFGMSDAKGVFKSKLPKCIGCFFKLYKDGYVTKIIENINTTENMQSVDVYMQPISRLNATVKLVLFEKLRGRTDGIAAGAAKAQAKTLQPGQMIMFNLRRVKDSQYEDEMTVFELFNDTKPRQIELAPGEYELRATFIDMNGVIIPKETKVFKYTDPSKIPPKRKKKVTIPKINYTPAMLGGIQFTENSGYLTITDANVEKGNVVFYILHAPIPGKAEDLKVLGRIEEISKDYRIYFLPYFS